MKKFTALVLFLAVAVGFVMAQSNVAVFPQIGHTRSASIVAFSPDGRIIVSGSSADNMVILWDVATGRQIRTLSETQDGVLSLAFSPDGRTIAAGLQRSVKTFDASTGREVRTFSDGGVLSLAFSPDGRTIASGSISIIKLWDVATGRENRTLQVQGQVRINSVAFSPDGRTIASSVGNDIRLWDAASGRETRTLSGHSDSVYAVAFSPDGRTIASGSGDRTIKLWDVSSGRETRTFSGHLDSVGSVVFSPDGRTIVSGSWDNTIRLWDVATGRLEWSLPGHPISRSVECVAFNPDGKTIATAGGIPDRTIKLWDVASGREIRTLSGNSVGVETVAFSPDGRTTASFSGVTIRLWDIASGRENNTFSGNRNNLSMAFNPNSRQILSGVRASNMEGILSPDGRTLAFKYILPNSWIYTLKLWDVASGREIRTLPSTQGTIHSIVYSPDGRTVAAGSSIVKLWDVASGREIRDLSGNSQSAFVALTFSPDGRTIIAGDLNYSTSNVRFWDVASGREIRTLSTQSNVYSVAYSPDGRTIVTGGGDGIVKLWDASIGREIRNFQGHLSPVQSVTFSPDNKYILSGSNDGTMRLWEISSGREIAQFIGFLDGEWIVITPEGYYNASPGGDKYLNVRMGNNVYGIDQYRAVFYKPQIVEAKLTGNTNIVIPPIRIDDVAQNEPPRITIRSPGQGTEFSAAQAQLSFVVEDSRQPIKDIKIMVNGRLVGDDELSRYTGTRNIRIRTEKIEVPSDDRRVELTIPITLEPGNNRIQVIATNNFGSEATAAVEAVYRTSTAYLPNLWILAVGVNRYDSPTVPDLKYAVNDAREIVAAFQAQEGKRFGKVNSLLITDDTPTKPTAANIVDSMDFLSRASQHDVILLFMAGHGIRDNRDDFYFVASDTTFSSDGIIQRSRAVSNTEIMRVRDLPGKKLLFIDACHSESAGGTRSVTTVDNNRLLRDLMEPSTVVFTSSTGRELSQELDRERHGAFTYAILQGLRGGADYDRNGQITMKALDMYVSRTVTEMTNGAQHPVSSFKDGNNVDFTIAVTR
jgi:WD40 repeat protein